MCILTFFFYLLGIFAFYSFEKCWIFKILYKILDSCIFKTMIDFFPLVNFEKFLTLDLCRFCYYYSVSLESLTLSMLDNWSVLKLLLKLLRRDFHFLTTASYVFHSAVYFVRAWNHTGVSAFAVNVVYTPCTYESVYI